MAFSIEYKLYSRKTYNCKPFSTILNHNNYEDFTYDVLQLTNLNYFQIHLWLDWTFPEPRK